MLIIAVSGITLTVISEIVYSIIIKKTYPREIRRDYIKNVIYRTIFVILVVGSIVAIFITKGRKLDEALRIFHS